MCVVKGLLQEIKTPWCQLQCPDVTPSDKRTLIDRVRKGDGQREREGAISPRVSHLGTDAMS